MRGSLLISLFFCFCFSGIIHAHHKDDVTSVAYSPDHNWYASASLDHTAVIWDVRSGLPSYTIEHKDQVNALSISPDSKFLVTGSTDKTAVVWKVESDKKKKMHTLKHKSAVLSVCYSPDGTKIATGTGEGALYLWDAETGTKIKKIRTKYNIYSLCFSPDEQHVVLGSENGIIIWDATTLKYQRSLKDKFLEVVNCVKMHNDYIASASNDGMVRIWSLSSGEVLTRLTGHAHYVTTLDFRFDGRRLLSGSEDNKVFEWDLTKKSKCAELHSGENAINSISYSPDGKEVVVGSRASFKVNDEMSNIEDRAVYTVDNTIHWIDL